MNPNKTLVAQAPQAGLPVGAYEREARASVSAVSWGAILAGAAGAAALSLILLILGVGLGLSSVSPWTGRGASAATMSASTIVWIAFTQLVASGMGGYLAGRLRTKWVAVHTDEVYFRDTAHGFLAWAVATLVTASVLTSAIGSIVGTGIQAGASGAAAVATSAAAAGAMATGLTARSDATSSPNASSMTSGATISGMGLGYAVDSLFRKDTTSSAAPAANPAIAPINGDDSSATPSSGEVARIFANDLHAGTMPPEDTRYVAQRVAQHTGLAQADAEKRVTETFNNVQTKLKDAETSARDAADKARKASAYAALWLFVSLLIGAFVASLAATFGGRRRDL